MSGYLLCQIRYLLVHLLSLLNVLHVQANLLTELQEGLSQVSGDVVDDKGADEKIHG